MIILFQVKGCGRCSPNQPFAKGNPCISKALGEKLQNIQKEAKAEGYTEKGSSQLTISDVRRLRDKLFLSAEAPLSAFQLFVIVLFAIFLGLRHDEFHDVKGKHFKTDPHNILRNVLLGI
jgi:hypothetical protein